MTLTARQLFLAAALAMSLAGASYARGAPAAESPLFISAIQVNPKHASVLYASTLDRGVIKSADGGQTWSAASTGLTVPPGSPSGSDMRVDALAMDPRSPNVLYAGTGLGVFKTNDGAKSWKLASAGIDLSADRLRHRLMEGFVYALAIDPLHPSTVYAAGGGIWKTTNGGATWKRVLRSPGINLGIDPLRPQTVYASVITGPRSTAGLHGALLKSVDGGGTWRATGPPGLRDNYFGHPIVVDRRSPEVVYAGGSGLFASSNQGRTWSKPLSLGSASRRVNAIALDPVSADVIYVGTWPSGILKSDDGGQTWSAPRLRGKSVSAIAIGRAQPKTIYAGVQWQTAPRTWTGGMFASNDGGSTWHRLI